MRTIKLDNYEVKIKEELTWGETKDIQEVMLKGVEINSQGQAKGLKAEKAREMVYKALEIAIEQIKDEDGSEVKFSKKWIDNLPMKDGNKLEDQANSFLGSARDLKTGK